MCGMDEVFAREGSIYLYPVSVIERLLQDVEERETIPSLISDTLGREISEKINDNLGVKLNVYGSAEPSHKSSLIPYVHRDPAEVAHGDRATTDTETGREMGPLPENPGAAHLLFLVRRIPWTKHKAQITEPWRSWER